VQKGMSALPPKAEHADREGDDKVLVEQASGGGVKSNSGVMIDLVGVRHDA
jgi:hypothetical protein